MHEVFQTRANVRAQGEEAFREGKPESACPYQEYTCAHREWVDAYHTARISAERAKRESAVQPA
ncbi:Rmf/CrpP family protein [Ralstonia thomasii]